MDSTTDSLHAHGVTITWKWLLDVAIAAAAITAAWLLFQLLISRRALLEPADEEPAPQPAKDPTDGDD